MIPPPFTGLRAVRAVELCVRRGVGRGRHAHPGRKSEALRVHLPFVQELGLGLQSLVIPRQALDEGDGWGCQLGVEAVHLPWDFRHQAARRE